MFLFVQIGVASSYKEAKPMVGGGIRLREVAFLEFPSRGEGASSYVHSYTGFTPVGFLFGGSNYHA